MSAAPDDVRLAWGCWIAGDSADDLEARCAGALTVANHDAVISHTTAALVHGLWLPDTIDRAIHVTTAMPAIASSAMTRTQRPQFQAHRRRYEGQDRTTVRGLVVTSLGCTWLDLATTLRLPDLVAAGDSALRSGATMDELAEVLRRRVHVRGVRRARQALALLDRRSRSRPESHLRVAIAGIGVPFEVNEPVYRDEGGWLAEPDLSLADARIALEYQGADHAGIERMRKDITRSIDLRREGWLCLLYGPAEVFGRPGQIAPELRALIRERAPHLLRPPRRR